MFSTQLVFFVENMFKLEFFPIDIKISLIQTFAGFFGILLVFNRFLKR